MAVINVTSFDPAHTTPGTINNPLPDGKGKWVVYNDSPVGIIISWGLSRKRIIAGWADVVDFCQNAAPGNMPSWMLDMTLGNAGQAPISIVQIDGYTPDEVVPNIYPVAIPRITNLGNTVPVATSANSVVNDGNVAPTQVVEATPSGALSSNLILNNDGSGRISGGFITFDALGDFTSTLSQTASHRINLGGKTGTTSAAEWIGGNSALSTETALQILSAGQALILTSDTSTRILVNAYNDGTDKFIANGFAFELTLNANATSILSVRESTSSGTAGGTISWIAFISIAQMRTAGGGAAGGNLWVGTTNPVASMIEGDVWINA